MQLAPDAPCPLVPTNDRFLLQAVELIATTLNDEIEFLFHLIRIQVGEIHLFASLLPSVGGVKPNNEWMFLPTCLVYYKLHARVGLC